MIAIAFWLETRSSYGATESCLDYGFYKQDALTERFTIVVTFWLKTGHSYGVMPSRFDHDFYKQGAPVEQCNFVLTMVSINRMLLEQCPIVVTFWLETGGSHGAMQSRFDNGLHKQDAPAERCLSFRYLWVNKTFLLTSKLVKIPI